MPRPLTLGSPRATDKQCSLVLLQKKITNRFVQIPEPAGGKRHRVPGVKAAVGLDVGWVREIQPPPSVP